MSEMPTIVPTGAALGADIEAVDLRTIDDTVFKAIEDAWHDNLVLRFRGQELDDDSLAEFSARFGKLEITWSKTHFCIFSKHLFCKIL